MIKSTGNFKADLNRKVELFYSSLLQIFLDDVTSKYYDNKKERQLE